MIDQTTTTAIHTRLRNALDALSNSDHRRCKTELTEAITVVSKAWNYISYSRDVWFMNGLRGDIRKCLDALEKGQECWGLIENLVARTRS